MNGPIRFAVGDTVRLKKKHPCSSDTFKVLRVGSDVRIVCTQCSRDVTLERQKLEKMTKAVIAAETAEKYCTITLTERLHTGIREYALWIAVALDTNVPLALTRRHRFPQGSESR